MPTIEDLIIAAIDGDNARINNLVVEQNVPVNGKDHVRTPQRFKIHFVAHFSIPPSSQFGPQVLLGS